MYCKGMGISHVIHFIYQTKFYPFLSIALDCGPLDAPRNGSFQGSLTVFPNVIKFSCHEGFVLRGSSSRACQANRMWSGSATQCEGVLLSK